MNKLNDMCNTCGYVKVCKYTDILKEIANENMDFLTVTCKYIMKNKAEKTTPAKKRSPKLIHRPDAGCKKAEPSPPADKHGYIASLVAPDRKYDEINVIDRFTYPILEVTKNSSDKASVKDMKGMLKVFECIYNYSYSIAEVNDTYVGSHYFREVNGKSIIDKLVEDTGIGEYRVRYSIAAMVAFGLLEAKSFSSGVKSFVPAMYYRIPIEKFLEDDYYAVTEKRINNFVSRKYRVNDFKTAAQREFLALG